MSYKRTRLVRKIEKVIVEKGYQLSDIEDIHWEPIGPCFEMAGRSGGWFINSDPLGLNVEEACDFIRQFGITLMD